MSHFSSVLVGHESLVIQCGELLRGGGHEINAVVTRDADVIAWAAGAGLEVVAPGPQLADRLAEQLGDRAFDWLLSIANLDILPASVLALPRRGAVNFHDGPLPAYAGLNAPVWAALAGERRHGIAWHLIEGGVDEGDILASAGVEITGEDTALSLNSKCYGAAIDSFPALMVELAKPAPARQPQDLTRRSYFGRDARPQAGAVLDFAAPAADLVRAIRALDHGDYWNPLCLPKFEAGGRLWLARAAHVSQSRSGAAPGAVLAADADQFVLATGDGDLVLTRITGPEGTRARATDVARVGAVLQSPSAAQRAAIDTALAPLTRSDPVWRKALEAITPADPPLVARAAGPARALARPIAVPGAVTPDEVRAGFALMMARLGGADAIDLALHATPAPGPAALHLCDWVPVKLSLSDTFAGLVDTFRDALDTARTRGPFAADLVARLAGADPALPQSGLSDDAAAGLVGPSALTLAVTAAGTTLYGDGARIDEHTLDLYAARLTHLLAHLDETDDPAALPLLPDAERQTLLVDWNATDVAYDDTECVHQAFEHQVHRTPAAEALAFEGESLSYAALNAAANRLAHRLTGVGVKPGVIVGLHLPRSADLVIAALAIMKAGGAYLPMDPGYPAERTALYLEDSEAGVVITTAALAAALPQSGAQILDIAENLGDQSDTNPDVGVSGTDLAYMIYTSGSTGRPKGVMVEHRNVANFFIGMDARIDHSAGGVWLAVTSLSFDISVLELFWTLARGFKLVISGDGNRALVAGEAAGDAPGDTGPGGMDFSLYYWGNDDGRGRGKYRSLLEGAKFADENGFTAVWTPERHFHAFGGPYPNPSVTGAAVAGFTRNIGVRAGSCVAPLHHTARIAEEWAVIDNLTGGRAGLAIASGWQPDDFVLRPENTPPANKPAMFAQIAELRRLWAGEPVAFPRQDGELHEVVTQPRPISDTLELWVTTAGNPETWKEAGRNGCNVLTHLLGQSIDEVAGKIKLYHDALGEAGHDPSRFKVTLMLHTFLAATREEAREIAREPMKDYLRSAAGLIKQYAWAFPAFKKPQGVDNAFQLDLGMLSEDELESILDFAFERYFNDSGLFGTVEDALERATQVKAIGVTEIACLIDYGIEVDTLLDGLNPLAQVVRAANASADAGVGTGPAAGDFSIAAQIRRHGVTHLQCTPSMARMLVMNDEAGAALADVKHICLGGEALPGALVTDLAGLTEAHIENMYGPTETTIWSTTGPAAGCAGVVGIGTPVANTQVYILDEKMQPRPIGVPGELWIGGEGVTRGYWRREDLTAERFVADPFSDRDGARLYGTGDLARWLPGGTLEYLGRTDFQVKLRGYRIEPSEIETAIDALGQVRQSVVVVREDAPGMQMLVAYVLADSALDEAALKAALAEALPAHMIPGRFVALDAFPLTPNRKVDRKALPMPSAPGVAARSRPAENRPDASKAAPEGAGFDGDVEAEVARIWTATLGVANISPRDNFFDLGGHSLLAVQAHREIKARLGVARLSITDIFRHPVLGDLAEAVRAKLGAGGASPPSPPAALGASQPAPQPAPPPVAGSAPPAAVAADSGAGGAADSGAVVAADSGAVVAADTMAQRREMRAARRRRRSG